VGRRCVALGGVGKQPMRIAAVFPGQGSQSLEMGCDVAAHSPRARALFKRAAALLGYDLLALQRQGPEEKLRETQFSQPAIFTTNLALYEAVGPVIAPVATAGHSFAELCSLVIARSLAFDDALRIVDARGKAMQAAAQRARGGMSAILGLEAEQVLEVLACAGDIGRVSLANYNSPTQIVISGELGAVQAAAQAMLDAGAKRVIPLNVSGAWHSALMEPAIEPLRAAVDRAAFSLPLFDVISNVDGRPYRDVETIKASLVRSVTDEVRWHATAQRLLTYGLDLVVEFGAGGVLTGLMKRMPGAVPTTVVSDFGTARALRASLERPAEASV
jgi:[acyl-carrier-protein] S-malonyltransferase